MNDTSLPDSSLAVGRRIRAERLRRHQTQEEFSRLLGISVSYLGALERGARPISRHVLHLLHERLDISYDFLMEGHRSRTELPVHNTLRDPGGYHARRNLSLMLGSCTEDEVRECYDLLHTYLNYIRSEQTHQSASDHPEKAH